MNIDAQINIHVTGVSNIPSSQLNSDTAESCGAGNPFSIDIIDNVHEVI